MNKKYHVTLTDDERTALLGVVSAGEGPARLAAHARILHKADRGPGGPGWPDGAIAEAVEVSRPTVERVRRRFAEEGLGAALRRRPARAHKPRKLGGEDEAPLIALACSAPPEGRARWSLRLLAGRLVVLEGEGGVSHETIRRTLKKTSSSRG